MQQQRWNKELWHLTTDRLADMVRFITYVFHMILAEPLPARSRTRAQARSSTRERRALTTTSWASCLHARSRCAEFAERGLISPAKIACAGNAGGKEEEGVRGR